MIKQQFKSIMKTSLSMPKAQRTKGSSGREFSGEKSKRIQYQQFLTCPQSCQLTNREKKYTHNLDLDYGRLQNFHKVPTPNQISSNKENTSNTKTNQFVQSNSNIQPKHQSLRSSGRKIGNKIIGMCRSETKLPKKEEGIDLNKIVRLKLAEVKVSEEKAENQGTGLHSIVEDLQDKMNQKITVQKPYKTKERKKLYTRIVKTYVGGGPMQTKIFTYPDTSQGKKNSNHI